jgi:AGCS family alanine or glycine:cation symporter
MAVAYVLLAVVVLVLNITEVPVMLVTIVQSALGFEAAAGGVTGGLAAAMLNGVQRGLFSNEAGMGSAPNIAACAVPQPHHPSSQGFVQALGVFIDTLIICTVTALVILLSGVFEPGSGLTGTKLTQAALEDHIGAFGGYFIAVAILFFAFTSIIGNYSYAENALHYLGLAGKTGRMTLRTVALLMVVWGAMQTVSTVFNTADASMGLMATINLIAIVLLSGTVVKLTRDYFAQRQEGLEPQFHGRDYPELEEQVETDIWYRDRG